MLSFLHRTDTMSLLMMRQGVTMKTVWVRQGYAIYHRLNDNEDKWIVSLNGETIPEEEILEAICFQEQYFMGELYTL